MPNDRGKDEVQSSKPDTFRQFFPEANPKPESIGQQIEIVFLEVLTRSDDGTLTKHSGQLIGFAVHHPAAPAEIRILDIHGVRRYKLTPIED